MIVRCQVGVYLGYVSRKEHALVDVRLYLNEEWTKDKRRRKKCGVPREIRFRTRHALSLQMLAEHGKAWPHAWIAGDDEMGRSAAFRRDLRVLGEQYLLAVPSNTLVRDLEAEPPAYSGHGRRPLEECLERAKGEAGLAQYQVRTWIGRHHHQTLSLLAAWFLTQEDRRGEKIHAGADGIDGSHDHRLPAVSRPRLRFSSLHPSQQHAPFAAKRTRLCVPLEIT